VVPRVVQRLVTSVPTAVWILVAGLGCLLAATLGWTGLSALRERRLRRQRNALLKEVGLLQSALLPAVPAEMAGVALAVAYRPSEGPAAGGDFYDCFPLPGNRVGLLVGDMSGHGADALAQTAHVRFMLRAYLEAGTEPRAALRLAGDALEDKLEADFVTVLVAVYDPRWATLTFASAGHPPPLIKARGAPEPVTTGGSPPIGVGLPTGLRQTAASLPGNTLVCLYTDGVVDARVGHGRLGRERLERLLEQFEQAPSADLLLDRVADTTSRRHPDDMAVCLMRTPARAFEEQRLHVEELELRDGDLERGIATRFLRACGVPGPEVQAMLRGVGPVAQEFGGAVLRVSWLDGAREFEVSAPGAPNLEPAESSTPVRRGQGTPP
jgi:serine phosphatase RsbU (regulator of sigma subunit)